MADVPIAPGVPALIRSGPAPVNPELLPASAQIQDTQRTGKNWGIFFNGQQIVTPDTFASIDYRQGWALADYPLENGAFETYNKVELPFDVRVRLASGGTIDNRQNLLRQIQNIAGDQRFYDVVTPEVIYQQCNIQHFDYRRTATNGVGLILIEVWLLEIRVLPQRGANVRFPSASPLSSLGSINTSTATSLQNTILNNAVAAGRLM